MKNKVLELKNICKSYTEFKIFNPFNKDISKIEVLKNVSFDIYESEIVGISGKNGSGKSTLLRVISGLENHDEGFINKQEKMKIRYISANDRSFFWRLNVIQNLELFNLYSSRSNLEVQEKMHYYMEIFNLADSKDTEFMKLSSGQKRKLILIRALLSGADILLFDEVSENLDESSKSIFLNEISKTRIDERKTFIWVSHDANELSKFCDRTLNIRDLNDDS